MGLIAGDVGGKAFIVFNLLTADFFGGVAGGFYFVGAVHALGECDFVSCAAIGFAYNAASEIFGDGEGFGTISYSKLSFSCILADGGVLVLSVHCCVFHGEGAVVIANHSSGDVLAVGVWSCVTAQVLADFFPPYSGISCGVYATFIGSGGDRAAVFIENGFCHVAHSANVFISYGCYIAFINIGLVESVTSQSNMVCFQSIGDFQIFSGELIIDYHIMSCNGAGSGDIYRISETAAGKDGCAVTDTGALYFTAGGNVSGGCDGSACNGAADDGAGAGIDSATAGQDTTAIGIYAAIGCYLAVCIDRKLSSRSFDFPFSRIQGSFCITIVIIASGVDTLFIHGSTVLAYFDSIFAEGNLVFAIFIQHQCIHSRGCGAVVSGDFGNHAVVAHFEIILGIGFPRIDFVNYFSITITGGFEGIVCFFGMVCFSGMGYIIDSNFIRCFPIIFCHYNHIFGLDGARDIRNNIRRFTQYAASCE